MLNFYEYDQQLQLQLSEHMLAPSQSNCPLVPPVQQQHDVPSQHLSVRPANPYDV